MEVRERERVGEGTDVRERERVGEGMEVRERRHGLERESGST